jgi:hypothetical protein
MNRLTISVPGFVLIAALFVAVIGCPDRSMLRPYPDLSKQSDIDSEEAEGAEPEEGETPPESGIDAEDPYG